MKTNEVWGIVGGLGPLASAEFVKSIYESSTHASEQEAPRLILHSDPSMPDRTRSFRENSETQIVRRLMRILDGLLGLGATRIIICCVTMHHVLDRCPAAMRRRIVSLVDVIAAELARTPHRYLVLCTQGARDCRVFERCDAWPAMRSKVVFPDAADQALVHEVIYRQVKRGAAPAEAWARLQPLLAKYAVAGFVAACTELHLLHTYLKNAGGPDVSCIDPLATLAADLAAGRGACGPLEAATAIAVPPTLPDRVPHEWPSYPQSEDVSRSL